MKVLDQSEFLELSDVNLDTIAPWELAGQCCG